MTRKPERKEGWVPKMKKANRAKQKRKANPIRIKPSIEEKQPTFPLHNERNFPREGF